jgi:hypothetical protein
MPHTGRKDKKNLVGMKKVCTFATEFKEKK